MKGLVSDTLWVRHRQVGKNIFYWYYILRVQNIVGYLFIALITWNT